MKYGLEHESRETFSAPVREHHCEIRLAPLEDERQQVASLRIETSPESRVRSYLDCYGNRVHYFDIVQAHTELTVRILSTVDTKLENPFGFTPLPRGQERHWLEREVGREPRLRDYVLHRSEDASALSKFGGFFAEAPSFDGKKPLMETIIAARDWLADHLPDEPPPSELAAVLSSNTGRARDLTHALLALIRSWGVPARYVSGYPDFDGDESVGGLYAWAEALIPGAGWRGFDAMERLVVNDRYVAVAVGRDAADVVPLRHAYKGEMERTERSVRSELRRQEQ